MSIHLMIQFVPKGFGLIRLIFKLIEFMTSALSRHYSKAISSPTCMSNCKGKNGKVYYRRVKAKVREHMRTCYLELTLSSVPKSIFMADSVCFLASRS